MGSSAGNIIGRILPLAASFIPGIGPLAAAGLGAAGGALSGGGLKGALLGGLGGGLTGGLGASIGTAAGLGSKAAGLLGSAAGGAVSGLASGGGLKSALMGGVTGAGANLAGNALSGGLSLGGGSSYAPTDTSGQFGGGSSYFPESNTWVDWKPSAGSDDLWNNLTKGDALGGIAKAGATALAGNQELHAQDQGLAELSPYAKTGRNANSMLNSQLQSGELGGTFDPGDLTQDPGYQFRLDQGEQAMNRSLGAQGSLFSGKALKAAQDYGQGLADQTYNDAYRRWLQGQQNTYGMLSGTADTGFKAALGKASLYDNKGDINANMTANLGNTFQQYLSGSGYFDPPQMKTGDTTVDKELLRGSRLKRSFGLV